MPLLLYSNLVDKCGHTMYVLAEFVFLNSRKILHISFDHIKCVYVQAIAS